MTIRERCLRGLLEAHRCRYLLDASVMHSPTLSLPSSVLGSHGVGHAANHPCAGEAASGRSDSSAILSALAGYPKQYKAQCSHEGASVFQGEGRQKSGIKAQARTMKHFFKAFTERNSTPSVW